jgi:hypothetical protein
MAMRIRRYSAKRIAQYNRSRATLDATICRHWASIRPVWPRRTPGQLRNRCFEATVQKARNGPSTQLIEATSCVERSNAMIQAKELSYLSSHQKLTADKKRQSYQSLGAVLIKN